MIRRKLSFIDKAFVNPVRAITKHKIMSNELEKASFTMIYAIQVSFLTHIKILAHNIRKFSLMSDSFVPFFLYNIVACITKEFALCLHKKVSILN